MQRDFSKSRTFHTTMWAVTYVANVKPKIAMAQKRTYEQYQGLVTDFQMRQQVLYPQKERGDDPQRPPNAWITPF